MSDREETSEEETSEEEVEMLATTRERRGNAGSKMASLLNQEDPDDFYKEAYGGFFDEAEDGGYASPGSAASSDEVDSDFDIDEEAAVAEDDAAADGEEDDKKRPRRKGVFTKAYKEPVTGQAKPSGPRKERLSSNQQSLVSTRQLRSPHVPRAPSTKRTEKKVKKRPAPGTFSQEQRLKEAKKTEALNLASLQKFRELETVEKLKRNKAVKKRPLQGPRILHISRSTNKGLMEHLMVYPSDAELPKLSPKVPPAPRACVVTGLPARYMDPLTQLPYADATAFKTIRGAYNAFLSQNPLPE